MKRAVLALGLLSALTFPAAAQTDAATPARQAVKTPTWAYGFLLITNSTGVVKFTSVSFNTLEGSMFAPTIEGLMDKLGAPRSGKPDRSALLELYGWLGAQGWELVQCQEPTPGAIEIERCIFKRPT